MKKEYKITIKQTDSHWEVTLWDNREIGGWYPVECSFGVTEVDATTKMVALIKQL